MIAIHLNTFVRFDPYWEHKCFDHISNLHCATYMSEGDGGRSDDFAHPSNKRTGEKESSLSGIESEQGRREEILCCWDKMGMGRDQCRVSRSQ